MRDPAKEYANLVLTDKIPACKYIKAACKRHLDDLKLSKKKAWPYQFDLEKGNRVIRFVRLLKHWKGPTAGQYYEPELWQQFIYASLFGWVTKEKRFGQHVRRFRYALLFIPRKNGKSFVGGSIGMYGLMADEEAAAEVYSLGTKKEQADIVWKCGLEMAKANPSLWSRLKNPYKKLFYGTSVFESLAADSSKQDGLNPHIGLFDELHQWRDAHLWDVIDDGMGARTQPLIVAITTAGYNKHGICYKQFQHVQGILEGKHRDDNYFGMIYTVDNEDDWEDENEWHKANPNLGVSTFLENMRVLHNQAKLQPSKENAFKNKQLNVWTESESKWLDMERWDKCGKKIDLEKIKGEPCYMGLDLSKTGDITCACCVFPPGSAYDEWVILPFFYIPGDCVRERCKRDRVPYDEWISKGFLRTTPGDMIDMNFIEADIMEIAQVYDVVQIGFDQMFSTQLATNLQTQGLDLINMFQGFRTLGGPTRDFEIKVNRGEFRHGGNPVLRWMAANTVVEFDAYDNIRPTKKKSFEKIDGIVAAIMALGRAISDVGEEASVYEERGVLEL